MKAAVPKRNETSGKVLGDLAVAGGRFHPLSGELRVGNHVVRLRPRTAALLGHLARNADQLISKDDLLAVVWPDSIVTEDSLVQCVKEIRSALGADLKHMLRTVPRLGYALISPDLLDKPARREAAEFVPPQTRYAKSGDVSIAYQVVGDGPLDLVYMPGWVSNVELFWEEPIYASFLTRLASFSRLILLDKRGTGLSDRVTDLPSLEVRMDDLRVVMDAVGSSRAVLFGTSEGGAMCTLFAATYPQRASALIMHAAFARQMEAPDHPWGRSEKYMEAIIEDIAKTWGTAVQLDRRAPSLAKDEHFRERWARRMRLSATAAVAVALVRMNKQIDIRGILPAIRVPTLLLHSVGDKVVDIGQSRYLASKIPGAKLVEMDSEDHFPIGHDADTILGEIEEFLTGVQRGAEPDRVLATILFTDIVDATGKAASMGDQRWREILDMHHSTVRRSLERFRGREIDTAGDGFFAAFDGPARAVRCACAISNDLKLLGMEVRAGVHTGECEVMGDKLGGISVQIGARVAALAQASEVLVSSTVKDLVAGSGLLLDDRGSHTLKGIPGSWRLFAAQH